ncbi:hypothetical protein V8B97DRAFT_1183389 [Scleroderma yunnanense]
MYDPSIDPIYSLSSSTSSASSPGGSSPLAYPAYQSDSPPACYLQYTTHHSPFVTRKHSSRHSSEISSPGFPESGIEIPPAAPLDKYESRIAIPHPYARLYAKKDSSKRRKIWNHVLEKQLFTPQELSTMGAPHRRTIYIASLEAHIDRLHNHLLSFGLYPVPFSRLEPYRGLNSKTAKSMVSGLQHDATQSKLKLLELDRSNSDLRKLLGRHSPDNTPHSYYPSAPSTISLEADVRRHTADLSGMGVGTHTHVDRLAYYSHS